MSLLHPDEVAKLVTDYNKEARIRGTRIFCWGRCRQNSDCPAGEERRHTQTTAAAAEHTSRHRKKTTAIICHALKTRSETRRKTFCCGINICNAPIYLPVFDCRISEFAKITSAV
jgi:hypothetical protein